MNEVRFARKSKTKATYHLSSPSTLLLRDLFNRALDLGDVDGLVVYFDDIAEDSAYFGEFVFVAGYEVEFCYAGHGVSWFGGI